MSSILSKTTIEKIENVRKVIMKVAMWLLVGGVILGAIMILFGGFKSSPVIGKFTGSIIIIAVVLGVSVNNFKYVKFEEAPVQVFALLGLVSNLICGLLWMILCWAPELGVTCDYDYKQYSICGMSLLFKFAVSFLYLSLLGFLGSNTLSIEEGSKRSVIHPLKITSVVCATYTLAYLSIMVFSDFNYTSELAARFGMLALFSGFAWFFVAIAALILSRGERKEKKNGEMDEPKKPKTDDELRAEIEEQVRREMIEKEVRERFEERKKNESEADNNSSEFDSDDHMDTFSS